MADEKKIKINEGYQPLKPSSTSSYAKVQSGYQGGASPLKGSGAPKPPAPGSGVKPKGK